MIEQMLFDDCFADFSAAYWWWVCWLLMLVFEQSLHLLVSTHLKNISQSEGLSNIYIYIMEKNVWNHQPVTFGRWSLKLQNVTFIRDAWYISQSFWLESSKSVTTQKISQLSCTSTWWMGYHWLSLFMNLYDDMDIRLLKTINIDPWQIEALENDFPGLWRIYITLTEGI